MSNVKVEFQMIFYNTFFQTPLVCSNFYMSVSYSNKKKVSNKKANFIVKRKVKLKREK